MRLPASRRSPVSASRLRLVRIEDFAASVAYRTDRLRADLSARSAAEILDDAASRAVWRAVRDAAPLTAEPTTRSGASPSARRPARPCCGRGGAFGGRGYLDWGGGLVWLAGPADTATHAAVEAAAQAARGTWTLLRAPDALRGAVDVVPPEPAPLARITRRVKAAIDPHGILNPGRIYAGPVGAHA